MFYVVAMCSDLRLSGTESLNGPYVHLPGDIWAIMEQLWNDIDGGQTKKLGLT